MDIEKECTLLGNLFHLIVTDLKSSSPAWEDFVYKGSKLHGLLKSVTLALFSFTESIQKIADLATNTKGSTKDVGSALTRICVRQKMVENKLKHFTNSLMDNLICPVQERLEEWKKVSTQLEKDHSKDYKKATQEIKKRNSDTIRLQKKARKGSKPDLHVQLHSVMHDVSERFAVLEETEKAALRNLLVEERSRICFFANCLSPVLDSQVSILNEANHLSDLSADMSRLCRNPKQLPTSTEQLVQDYIDAHTEQSPSTQDSHPNGFLEASQPVSPPSTPTSENSRKSSICSLNSLTSSDSVSSGSLNRSSSSHQRRYQGHHRRDNSGNVFSGGLGSPSSCKSAPVTGFGGARLSVSSHDSGFVSTGNGNVLQLLYPDSTPRHPAFNSSVEKTELSSDVANGSHPVIRGRSLSQQASGSLLHSTSQNRFSWKDWEKPGPYDKYQSPSKTDSSREILPGKSNQPPPILTPKPFSYQHRSSSTDQTAPLKIPLHRANTLPSFHLLNKDDPLPPPPQNLITPEEPLPPPPPALLGDDTVPPPPAPTHSFVPPSHPYTPSNNDFAIANLNRKNSLNSLQYSTSSGYCSQYSTPACSEDAIPSQDLEFGRSDDLCNGNRYGDECFSTVPRTHQTDYQSKTLPRNALHRHASTDGLPSKETVSNKIEETGTATIRRKPSSKSLRRKASAPKAVAPPTVPNFLNTSSLSTYSIPFNSSNNNNKAADAEVRSYSDNGSSIERRKLSVNRDLALLFQQSPDHRGDSPTPTTTPVVGDANHPADTFYASMPQSPYLDRSQE